jgi:predicted ribosomally synthesized peptide with SipW-like signal peptide
MPNMKNRLRGRWRIVSLLVLMLVVVAVGATLAYFTVEDTARNTFTVGKLNITLGEEGGGGNPWDNDVDGKDLFPGTVIVKRPYVTAVDGDSFLRIIMTIEDTDSGDLIDDPIRLDKILSTLYYDPLYDDEDERSLEPGLSMIYTEQYLNELQNNYNIWNYGGLYNYLQFLPVMQTTDHPNEPDPATFVYYYCDRTGTEDTYSYVLKEGTTASLITHVVIPWDWDQDDLDLLGEYSITFRAEAIQAQGFVVDGVENHVAAFAALDTALA